ncbi:MAG: hypothetical protein QY322_02845 [bacterium]|nr:MAG: hypothetical protein QY322_02845 [bacterium]
MPKDNNQTQNPQNNTVPVADDMPPVMIEDTSPPMVDTIGQPPINNTPTPTASPTTDTGSAAPSDDIVMPSVVTSGPNAKGPSKKFGGGKVIATILGLFLLIGGVGAGTYLVQQNQDIREKASLESEYEECRRESGTQVCNCRVYGNCTRPDAHTDPQTPWVTAPPSGGNTESTCQSNGGYWCDEVSEYPSNNLIPGFCNTSGQTCGNVAASLGYTIRIGEGMPGTYTGGWYCRVGVNGYTGGPCLQSNSVPGSSPYSQPPNCFCGTIQIDGGNYDGTYVSSCGCDDDSEPPATTPSITAKCQDVKAYDEKWAPLTSAQLSQLKTGDDVNFCVTGSASSGSFNKARFTINTVQQAETTTIRPTSPDYCQSYTIPAGVTTFNVTAQINHTSLGWK